MTMIRMLSVWWALVGATVALASDEQDFASFCAFGPKVRVLSPVHDGDRCKGSAVVQALIWECSTLGAVSAKLDAFRRQVAQVGAEECAKHCRRYGKKCRGKFDVPSRCGLETDSGEAAAAGRQFGCRKDCGGQAFIFCSIYHAGYRLQDPSLMANARPNCHCTPEP